MAVIIRRIRLPGFRIFGDGLGCFLEIFVVWENVTVDMDYPFSVSACRWWVGVIVAIYCGCFRVFVVIASQDVCPHSACTTLRKFRPGSLEVLLVRVGMVDDP